MTGCACQSRHGVVAPFPFQPTRNRLSFLGDLGADPSVGSAVVSTYKGAAAGTAAGGAVASGVAAAIGSGAVTGSVVPIIGTAIGAIAGLLASGILSKSDQEVQNWNDAIKLYAQNAANVFNISDKYLILAGMFDLSPSLMHTNIPIWKKYGHFGEQRFVNDLVSTICSAAKAQRIGPNDTAATIMANIVQPWIDGFGYGPMQDPNADLINEVIEGMVAEYVAGLQTRWLARGGDFPFGNLPKFADCYNPPASAQAPSTPGVGPVGSAAPAAAEQVAIAGQGTLVANAEGNWSFGTACNANGYQVLLNGAAQAGVCAVGMTTYNGSVYQVNAAGAWYSKAPGQGWAPSAAPPNGNQVVQSAATFAPYAGAASAAAPPQPAAAGSAAVGPAVFPGTSGSLQTGDGQWSFGTACTANGFQVLLNGAAQPGVCAMGMTSYNGSVYQINAAGAWYSKAPGQGWAPSPAPPNGNQVAQQAGLFGTATVQPVGSSSSASTQSAAAGSSSIGTTSSGQSVTTADLQAFVSQLASQGASAQQAYTSALQALQSQGIQATPQVQQAVQQAVSSAAQPAVATAGFDIKTLGIVLAVGAGFMLFKPQRRGGGGSRRRRATGPVSFHP